MAEPHGRRGPRYGFRGTGIYWSLLVMLVLGAAIIVGIVQNTQNVELKYLGWDAHTPLIAVLLIAIFITAVFTELVGVVWRRRRRDQLTARAELQHLQGQAGTWAASGRLGSSPAGGSVPDAPPLPSPPPPVSEFDPPRPT